MNITLRVLKNADLAAHLSGLARLRITVFREFPYLYDGTEEYERRYLETYAAAQDSVIIGAFDTSRGNGPGELVGASTALPLRSEPAHVTEPLGAAGVDIESCFYYGESVLLPAYRGQGLGVRFFEEREAQARQLGYRTALFCAVVRPEDHPRRPPGYVPLDAFWHKRGYRRIDVTCYFSWKELGETEESKKPMAFWTKELT